MAEAPKITVPSPTPEKFSAAKMAYGGMSSGSDLSALSHSLFRMERGFVFLRGGVAVSAIPQFKGLTLYSHTSNTPAPFQTTQTGKNIKWPSPPGKAK